MSDDDRDHSGALALALTIIVIVLGALLARQAARDQRQAHAALLQRIESLEAQTRAAGERADEMEGGGPWR